MFSNAPPISDLDNIFNAVRDRSFGKDYIFRIIFLNSRNYFGVFFEHDRISSEIFHPWKDFGKPLTSGPVLLNIISNFPKYFYNLEITLRIIHLTSSGFPNYLTNLLNSSFPGTWLAAIKFIQKISKNVIFPKYFLLNRSKNVIFDLKSWRL
jgi:hypothetical protein